MEDEIWTKAKIKFADRLHKEACRMNDDNLMEGKIICPICRNRVDVKIVDDTRLFRAICKCGIKMEGRIYG